MPGFPLGTITLLVVAFLVYFGLAQRVLDRLYLNDKAALAVVAGMAVGSFIDIPLVHGRPDVSINLGGGVIPIGLAVYVLARTGTAKEVARALLATGITAAAIYVLNSAFGRVDPFERRTDILDPLYLYPLAAGVVAYVAGRSRRSAFIAAVLGVLVLDVVDFFRLLHTGIPGRVDIGGAGAFDVTVLAGVIAVLLAELIGELRERLQGGVAESGRPTSLFQALKKPALGEATRKSEQGGGED